MNKWVIYWLDVFAVRTPTLNIIHKQVKWSQTERWVLDRSGRRQLRSRSYNCAVWHTYPGNFREGSTQHAVINQCLNPRQVNGEEEKNECEDRERGRNKRDGKRYCGGRYRARERGIQSERGEASLSKPHPSPAKPPFLPLPLFSCWNLFILGLFLLCELFTRNMMDD